MFSLCQKNVSAAIFMVSSQEQFSSALRQSAVNKENDEILIAQGAVIHPEPYQREIGYSLHIASGYDLDFVSRTGSAGEKSEPVVDPSAPIVTPPPQRSTSGPVPGPIVTPKPVELITSGGLGTGGGSEAVLGVPGYLWRHGCGPRPWA